MKTLVVDWINVVISGMRSEFCSDLTSSLSDWGWLTVVDIGLGRFLANLIAEMNSNLIFSGKDGWCDQLVPTVLNTLSYRSVSTMSFQQWNNARIWHHTCFYSFLFMLRKLESKLMHTTSKDIEEGPITVAKCDVRVTSVDPDDGFKPIGGKVQELSFESKPNVWAYFSVKVMLSHLESQERLCVFANMVLGLKEIQIRDEIRTNVDYTIDLLHAPDYRDNKIHTGWLDSRIAMRVRAKRPPWYLLVVGGALYKAAAGSIESCDKDIHGSQDHSGRIDEERNGESMLWPEVAGKERYFELDPDTSRRVCNDRLLVRF
ncbi:acetyl-CoA carboxylase 1-like protein [Tanacetum coccineum]